MTDEQRLQMITEQLILVRDNLFRGMSKSIQKLQARSINEVLELPNHTQSPPAQQEPVAWYRDEDGIRIYYESKVWDDATPLYTSPPAQRTWVGLTEKEIARVVSLAGFSPDWAEAHIATQIVRVLEAKLKEKNT